MQWDFAMAKKATYLARAGVLLGGLGLIATWAAGGTGPCAAWMAATSEVHIMVVALLGNLLFVAYPFRRRCDLALGLAILIAGADVAAHAPFGAGFADAVGIAFLIMPVCVGRLRQSTQRERRKRSAWRRPRKLTGEAADADRDAARLSYDSLILIDSRQSAEGDRFLLGRPNKFIQG
jgi:hypothetical protein